MPQGPPPPDPGGEHPDDTFAVEDATFPVVPFDLEAATYRLAVKKGKAAVIDYYNMKRLVMERDAYVEGLPDGTLPDQGYLASVDAEIARLYESFGPGQEVFYKEYETVPDIAVLANGFNDGATRLLNRFLEPAFAAGLGFSPADMVKDHPVLVIPSGGLMGLETSSFFKASLDEYVKLGGTLVVFAQQRGYEFGALPVPVEPDGTYKQVSGYGWTEDQNCFANAVYFDTWHQMFSGQGSITPTVSVDGYFTSYPSNAAVLLRRTANGQPAMIMYAHGLGKVVVTTMYSDWAYGHSQASKDEMALVRDMVAWAKRPAQMPETAPGKAMSLEVTALNNTGVDAASVRLTLLAPDRTVITEQTVPVAVVSGGSVTVPFTYQTLIDSPLGIYHVDYTLLDSAGNMIQPRAETDSGRLVVSSPPSADAYRPKDLLYSINVASESALYGQDVPYTLTVWNNSALDKRLKLYKDYTHWWDAGFLEDVVVPAHGSIQRAYTQNMVDPTNFATIWVHFLEEGGTPVGTNLPPATIPSYPGYAYVGSVGKRMTLIVPSATVKVNAGNAVYRDGDTANFSVEVKNAATERYPVVLDVTINRGGTLEAVYSQTINMDLPAGGTVIRDFSYAIPSTAASWGTYGINAQVKVKATGLGFAVGHANFKVARPTLVTTPQLPQTWGASNNISFNVRNAGLIAAPSAVFTAALRDGNGSTVWSRSLTLTDVAVGTARTIDFIVPVDNPIFGSYRLVYSNDVAGGGVSAGETDITNNALVITALDKGQYRVREGAALKVDLINIGAFSLDNAVLTVSAPDMGYTYVKAVSMPARTSAAHAYLIPIPDNAAPGAHQVTVTLELPSGSSISKQAVIVVPDAAIYADYAGAERVSAGGALSLTFGNSGGVDAGVSIKTSLTGDGVVLYQGASTDTLAAGASKALTMQVPAQAANGSYTLLSEVTETRSGKATVFKKGLFVSGVSAWVDLKTDKNVYLPSDNVTVTAAISNNLFALDNATLRVEAVDACAATVGAECREGVVWQTDASVTQAANTTQGFVFSAGAMPKAGQYFTRARLASSTGQAMTQTAGATFNIASGGVAMRIDTNKALYKPFEPVMVRVSVDNLSTVDLSGVTARITLNAFVPIMWETFTPMLGTFTVVQRGETVEISFNLNALRANETRSFTFGLRALPLGKSNINGAVTGFLPGSGQAQTLADARGSFETDVPVVTATATMPDVVDDRPFDVNIELKNTGRLDATVYWWANQPFYGNAQGNGAETLRPGETRLIQRALQINRDTVLTVSFSGASPQSVTKNIVYGYKGYIRFGAPPIAPYYYPAGTVGVPVTIANTGLLDQDIEATYELDAYPYGAPSYRKTETRKYHIKAGETITDTLSHDLPFGYYHLRAITTGGFKMNAPEFQSFVTLQENAVSAGMSLTWPPVEGPPAPSAPGPAPGPAPQNLIVIDAYAYNWGWKAQGGIARLTISNQNGVAFTSDKAVAGLQYQNTFSTRFEISPNGLLPGAYDVAFKFISDSGMEYASPTRQLTITAPNVVITALPQNPTFTAGQFGAMSFTVKNTGNHDGEARLALRLMDSIDATRAKWLKAGESAVFDFGFPVPDDIEDKDYIAAYSLNGVEGQVKLHVAGMKMNVASTLDRTAYSAGDTAMLTLRVDDARVGSPNPDMNFFARVNYGGHEEKRTFTLGANPSETLLLSVPLPAITGEKLFYGIYYESGRSIHLNTLYVYEAGGPLNITTDKQVYNPGDTVLMTITGAATGTLNLTGPGNYSASFAFAGSASKSFVLPTRMTAGTYLINWSIGNARGAHAIDVDGIRVTVKEAALDRAKYPASADVAIKLTIESNRNMAAVLRTWFVAPDGAFTASASKVITLTSGALVLEGITAPFYTTSLGIHRLVYAVYDNDMLLASGSEAFDVGEAVLLDVSTDKSDYPLGTEAVNAAISLFGAVPGTVDLYVDGLSAGSFTASLNGFVTHTVPLTGITPGAHTLKAVLNSGGLTSVKETGFVYGSALPDLSVSISRSGAVGVDNRMAVTVTVVNSGKTASSATTVTLYDAAPGGGIGAALETFSVGPLAPGASASFTYYLDVAGRGGANTLYASVDGGNSVYEFNNSNNTAAVSIEVPEAVFHTTIGADVNYTGDTMYITANITNLSTVQLAGLTLVTGIKNQSGAQVHSIAEAVPAINAVTRMPFVSQWYIPDDTPEGQYTVSQTLGMGGRSYGTTVTTVTVKPGRDFTMESSHAGLKVESGGAADVTVGFTPVRGFADEVILSVSGAPQGVTVRLSKDTLTPPDSSVLSIGATGVAAGTYVITVSASGGGKTHSVDLTLDVADFAITLTQSTQTVQELETAVYGVILTPLNGFESLVALNIQGLPAGMKAVFDNNNVMPPASTGLKLITSKWLRPGNYVLKIKARGTTAYHEETVTLVVIKNPLIAPGIVTVPGPGPNNDATIKKFNGMFAETASFYAMRKGYGANAVAGDIDGDGIDEIIVGGGADPNGSSSLDVFRRDGTLLAGLGVTPFTSTYGVTIAVGDIDGDWKEEVVVGTGPDPNTIAMVKVYRYDGVALRDTGMNLYPYASDGYHYGVNLALGDVDGDGLPEIITAPGPDPNAPPKVKAFKIDSADGAGLWRTTGESAVFTAAFGTVPAYGANVAAADLDADGRAEIVVGAGPDPNLTAQNVLVYDSSGAFTGRSYAAGVKPNYGAYVSAGDLDLDGKAEVITGSGPDPKNVSIVRVFREDGIILGEFTAYVNTVKYGVKPAVARVGE